VERGCPVILEMTQSLLPGSCPGTVRVPLPCCYSRGGGLDGDERLRSLCVVGRRYTCSVCHARWTVRHVDADHVTLRRE
jgi:hypothetical protein